MKKDMSQRIPLASVLAHVTDELKKVHSRSVATGQAIMQFEECEFEFAVETEMNAEGGLDVWIINLSGVEKRTESNTVRIKYTKIANNPLQAEQGISDDEGPEI